MLRFHIIFKNLHEDPRVTFSTCLLYLSQYFYTFLCMYQLHPEVFIALMRLNRNSEIVKVKSGNNFVQRWWIKWGGAYEPLASRLRYEAIVGGIVVLIFLVTPLCSASFFSTWLHSVPVRYDLLWTFSSALPAPLCSLRLRLRSAQLWSLCSCPALLAPTCTALQYWLVSFWIILISSALFFSPLDLLIPLKIT